MAAPCRCARRRCGAVMAGCSASPAGVWRTGAVTVLSNLTKRERLWVQCARLAQGRCYKAASVAGLWPEAGCSALRWRTGAVTARGGEYIYSHRGDGAVRSGGARVLLPRWASRFPEGPLILQGPRPGAGQCNRVARLATPVSAVVQCPRPGAGQCNAVAVQGSYSLFSRCSALVRAPGSATGGPNLGPVGPGVRGRASDGVVIPWSPAIWPRRAWARCADRRRRRCQHHLAPACVGALLAGQAMAAQVRL
jgi:hypothetical protein